MTKLLYITNGIKGAGGLERVLSIKASYLADILDYEVHILTLNNNRDSFFYDFSNKIIHHDISVIGNPLKFYFNYSVGIKKIINKVNPDIISVCDDGLKGFFLPLLVSKTPIIYERHASIKHNTSNGIKGKITKIIMRYLGSKFDKFVVLTNANKDEWQLANIKVIPNPLSFYPEQTSTLENPKVIVVGTHSYNKGYDLLLQAWEIISKKHTNWSLNIYGKVDTNKTFIKLATQLNLNNSVNFYEPTTKIEEAYLDASILVLSSRTEGFGMVLIEAMACGLPCVSFDCPSGPGDIILNNEDGFLIQPENSTAFAEKIIVLIENEQVRKAMGKKAKQNVKRYLPDNIIAQWDELFKSLLQ